LDFGPHRSPAWLMDYLQPDEDHLKHWSMHNHLSEPSIDLDRFRIQVRGIVENDDFVRKLRDEIESPERQDLQKNFLNRGSSKYEHNRTFLIWDLTTRPEVGTRDADSRPTTFTSDQFFTGGRLMYNLGRYAAATQLFEEGISRVSERWSDKRVQPYLYHYIKSLHALGQHQKAIDLVEQTLIDIDLPIEVKAALEVANGLGYWKLGIFQSAMVNLNAATDIYNQLAIGNVKHKIDEADSFVLQAIVTLEKARAEKNTSLISRCQRWIDRADRLFSDYADSKPTEPETHYKGRYWGLKAFYLLACIDAKSGAKEAALWKEPLEFASRAHGGEDLANRNPFGAICGKYCAAAVNYHQALYCEDRSMRLSALIESARIIRDVHEGYRNLFGPGVYIYRTWPKIQFLRTELYKALPDTYRNEPDELESAREQVEPQEVFTPLH
jgi:tetratricopeptide (TPR) repeat protein